LQLQLAALFLLIAGCASVDIPRPTPGDVQRAVARWPQSSMADLEHGRSLYLARSTRCHRPIEPKQFSASVWKEQVLEMRERARLSDDDLGALSRYLAVMAQQPKANPNAEPSKLTAQGPIR
jgi:hypothetical protein